MELRHLRYFVAVAEELNFRRAAERLNVSRPGLSKQIKELENEISVRLLTRNTVSVSLTPAGEAFLTDARAALAAAQRAADRAIAVQRGDQRRLKIGSVGMIATDFLPGTLKAFRQRHPDVQIDFLDFLPEQQLDALESEALDIGFTYGEETGGHRRLESHCVLRSPFGVALSSDNPLARAASIELAQVAGRNLLCAGREPHSQHRETTVECFSAEGAAPGRVRQVEGFDTLLNLISADEGISLLPSTLDLNPRGIRIVPITFHRHHCEFRMWAVWKRTPGKALVQAFVGILKHGGTR